MCGIAGIWSNHRSVHTAADLKKMTDAIIHRGPDGSGHWISEDGSVALGHRRLAIIDLSEGGAQPMHFMDRYVITFNGEIYNYLELKKELAKNGHAFKSDSDTEVVLVAYAEWGIRCLEKFDGMFAFAIYDKVKKELFCARDRFGEKPFYYCFKDGNLYFGSEMKEFWSVGIRKAPNNSMLYNYLANDLVENPNDQRDTFYDGVVKLKPAHYFIYKGERTIEQLNYWKINTTTTSDLSFEAASGRLNELLAISVQRRLRSDVPVGTSLSGGLDSSTIVGLVAQLTTDGSTFSARFPNFSKDEGYFIELVQEKFKTIHHNVVVDADGLIQKLDKLIFHQEEPFLTGSIFAQYCVYEAAKKNNVIVMLDGQGADELLGGYDKDFKFYLRELIHGKGDQEDFIHKIFQNHNYKLTTDSKERLKILSPSVYQCLAKAKKKFFRGIPTGITTDFHREFAPKTSPFKEFDDLKSMLNYELTNQGLEKLLKFADRNSMAHSVEVRLPFLYHELVEFVFSLKSEYFLKDGWSKALLRNAMKETLPNEIVYRKDKIGFEAPHDTWSRNEAMNEMYIESKSFLVQQGVISSNYSNRWKTIVASKFLQG
jgi:asparagine synthase (glutamine-hydrolysing)